MNISPEEGVSHGGHREKAGRKKTGRVTIQFSQAARNHFRELADVLTAACACEGTKRLCQDELDILYRLSDETPKELTPELLANIWEIAWKMRKEAQYFSQPSKNPKAGLKLFDAWGNLSDVLHGKCWQSEPVFTVVEVSRNQAR